MELRNERHHAPFVDGRGAVIKASAHGQRQPHEREQIKPARGLPHRAQRVKRAGKQRLLQKEVAACVARQAKLREYRDLHAERCGLPHQVDDGRAVVCRVAHTDGRRRGGDLHKSFLH